jgi:hypothetical protein
VIFASWIIEARQRLAEAIAWIALGIGYLIIKAVSADTQGLQ